MKQFKIFALIALFVGLSSVAFAAGIPATVDPKNSPEIWTMEVYNNTASAMSSGTVVSWDQESDTTDALYAYRTMWVSLPSGDDDVQVAGVVVDDSILSYGQGTICIWGPVYALVADSSDAVTALDLIGTYSTGGQCGDFSGGSNDHATLGYSIYAAPVSVSYGGYGGTDGKNHIMQPIFVDIARAFDD